MIKTLVTVSPEQTVGEAVSLMRKSKLRILPVIDSEGKICGVFSTKSMLRHVVPEYIISGEMTSIPFAPDIGMLQKHYSEIMNRPVSEVMDSDPLLVNEHESLLSTASNLAAHEKWEYAFVVDESFKLMGIVSSGDILDRLHSTVTAKSFDA
ncbi:MAG: CBS domain-containing protein [Mariprofundaceae bacterium]